jgi:hypothetical protein
MTDETIPGASDRNMTREEAAEALARFVASPELAVLAELAFEMADPFVVGEHWLPRERTAQEISAENKLREEAARESVQAVRLELNESIEFPISTENAVASLEAIHEQLGYVIGILKKALAPPPPEKVYTPDPDEEGVTE